MEGRLAEITARAQTPKRGLVSAAQRRDRWRPCRSPVPARPDAAVTSRSIPQQSCASEKKSPSCPHQRPILVVLCLQTQRDSLANFGGPGAGRPSRFDLTAYRPARSPRGDPPPPKKAPRPGQGGVQRGTASDTSAPPISRQLQLMGGPAPRCSPRPGRQKNSPVRPLGAPTNA
jgi:hypothetical protein